MKDTSLENAVDAALKGDWNAAHNIVQHLQVVEAHWLHAVLHKMEGDEWNSKYWYAKTHGKKYEDFSDPQQELVAIRNCCVTC